MKNSGFYASEENQQHARYPVQRKRYKSEQWKIEDGDVQRDHSVSGFSLQLYSRAEVMLTAPAACG